MSVERANQLVTHPLHQQAFTGLVEMLVALRQCASPEDNYNVQQELLAKILEVEGRRLACRRVARRLWSGKTVPRDAPDLMHSGDVNDPESWEIERDVCERVARQLRSLGDALAWRMFDYNRGPILALSRNAPVSPIVNKEGLIAERSFIEEAWKEHGVFVLLHDLTSCLRIGDATEFRLSGDERMWEVFLHEIKTDPSKQKSTQRRRMRLATEALNKGTDLPGDEQGRLVPLSIPYKTHLGMLRDALLLAGDRGVQGIKVPGGRMLLAANLFKGYTLWPEAEFFYRTAVEHEQALKRAGILDRGDCVTFRSDDHVGRQPLLAPWTIYPLPPDICAGLSADILHFSVTISSEPLREALAAAGLRSEWVLPPGQERLESGQPILRVMSGAIGVEMTSLEMARLLLELVDLDTWASGVKDLLRRQGVGYRPWPYFKDEGRVWTGHEPSRRRH